VNPSRISLLACLGLPGVVALVWWLTSAAAVSSVVVVVVVSAKSAITNLSKSQIVDIFLGRSNRFPNGTVAVPIDQAEGSAARDGFYEELAGKSPVQMKAYWAKIIFAGRGRPPKVVLDSAAMKGRVAADPEAIGYMDASLLDVAVRVLP
jgi:ABC-type phosphate transport system substrate-binding protein